MPVSCPTVNSLGAMFAWNQTTADLLSIDKATGIATVVGNSGLGTFEQGLAFDNFDVLVLVSPGGMLDTSAYSINTTTGANTLINTITGLPRAHHGDFQPLTNYYWGIDQTDDSAGGAAARNLLVLEILPLPGISSIIDTLPTADYLHCVTFGYRVVYVAT